ncbi:shikimate kinase AroL [Maridesulfovibrio zosterae]|uniref:shikimate kinase AroL n=1 Tax=Maridesulfovibrio zosterae TaxID=82171 RepID=UPI000411D08B|nr:shikimate kinase AroL [Maridesulfovibrio zosterae]
MSNIYLIGPRACGKTTVAKILSEKLQFKFYDSDEILIKKAGCQVSEYVDKYGWEGFRDLECEVLKELVAESGAVVSCGGGIVVREENIAVLRNAYTVYLKTNVQVLAERLKLDPNHGQRPSLTGKPLVEEIQDILNDREPLYRGCAKFIVDGAGSIDDVCKQILDNYISR